MLSRLSIIALVGAAIVAGATGVVLAADAPAWLIYAVALAVCAVGTMHALAPGAGLALSRRVGPHIPGAEQNEALDREVAHAIKAARVIAISVILPTGAEASQRVQDAIQDTGGQLLAQVPSPYERRDPHTAEVVHVVSADLDRWQPMLNAIRSIGGVEARLMSREEVEALDARYFERSDFPSSREMPP